MSYGHKQNEPNVTFQFHPWSEFSISFFFPFFFVVVILSIAVYKLLKKLLRLCEIWDQFSLNVNFFFNMFMEIKFCEFTLYLYEKWMKKMFYN